MGIEINYSDTDDQIVEVERNNIVIKERFIIAYYRLPYIKIPSIMIRHLAMNVTQNLNLFPAKGRLSAYYIPHMILSHRNWDYNKHCQVEFSAYVHASQVNDPKNTNCLGTLDGIYLCPAHTFQGGHQIMDLRTGQLITTPKVVEIHITDIVINAVKKCWRRKYLIH